MEGRTVVTAMVGVVAVVGCIGAFRSVNQAATDISAGNAAMETTWSANAPKTDPMTNKVTTSAMVGSKEKVTSWLGAQNRAWLVVRCVDNTTELMVMYEGAIEPGEDELLVKLDDAEAEQWTASPSTDHKGLFVDKAPKRAAALSGHSKAMVRFANFKKGQADVVFDLTGYDAAVKPVREACHW